MSCDSWCVLWERIAQTEDASGKGGNHSVLHAGSAGRCHPLEFTQRLRHTSRSQLDVVLLDRLMRSCAESFQQLGDDRGLVLRVSPRPGPRLHLEEIAFCRRLEQAIEMHEKLKPPVSD